MFNYNFEYNCLIYIYIKKDLENMNFNSYIGTLTDTFSVNNIDVSCNIDELSDFVEDYSEEKEFKYSNVNSNQIDSKVLIEMLNEKLLTNNSKKDDLCILKRIYEDISNNDMEINIDLDDIIYLIKNMKSPNKNTKEYQIWKKYSVLINDNNL